MSATSTTLTLDELFQQITVLPDFKLKQTNDAAIGLLIQDVVNPKILSLLDTIQWQTFDLMDFNDIHFSERFDIALLQFIPSTSLQDITLSALQDRVLQRCRDMFARRTMLLIPSSLAKAIKLNTELIALGFQRLPKTIVNVDDATYIVWQFNLFDYKHLPDWLNSRFWANPENWNKYRW